MRFLRAILRALASIATMPLRMLGIGGVTPSDIAAAAIDAEPGPAAPQETHPLGDLIRAWADRRLYGSKPGAPALSPLPGLVQKWVDGMDRGALSRTTTTPSHLLERHVAAGPDGQLRSLGLVVPVPDVPALPANDDRPGQTRGLIGEDPSLDDVLQEFGYKPVRRYRG